MPMTLHPAALRAQVASLAGAMSADDPPVIAFHGDLVWTGGDSLQVGDRGWQVRSCRSPIEVREVLAYRDADAGPLVILTPLSHADLGVDVVARLHKRRLFEFDRWEPILRVFGAHRLDARLASQAWLADALLTRMPPEGYARVASGTLDATTAWRHAVQLLLGVDAQAIDAASVLQWTLEPGFIDRWNEIPPEAREPMVRWIAGIAGKAGHLALAMIEQGVSVDAVPIALACDVLFADGSVDGARADAIIRLERYTGGQKFEGPAGRSLAEAAQTVIARAADARKASTWLARADEILEDLGAGREAYRGRMSPSGFSQRLDAFASVLVTSLDASDPAAAIASATLALDNLKQHDRARSEPDLVARAEHAVRLVRYLRAAGTAAPPASFADAVAAYAREHAFADEARVALYASDTHQAFGVALGRVAERTRERREQFTGEFARLAGGWFEAPAPNAGFVCIEHVVRDVLAPLASRAPVLLLVVDGMSLAVAHAMVASIAARGWTLVALGDGPGAVPVVAALPSVTEVCRTSLFCGKLRIGTAIDERSGFAAHPDLVAKSKPTCLPRLFHKADLGAGAALAQDVADAIANPDQRIVGAVVNAVDDHLLKDDMVRPTWGTQYVPIIAALCDAARIARRAIVLTSDHGHVLDLKLTNRATASDSDRYRPVAGATVEGELKVSGPRVVASAPSIVVAASEGVRYASRKNGYHGGVSPQELVVPLAVLCPDGHVPDGWSELPAHRPGWCDLELDVATAPAMLAARGTAPGLPLFDQPLTTHVVTVVEAGEPEWLAGLLASDAYAEQRERASRAALSDDRLRAMLMALSARGGRMTTVACAAKLGVPVGRLSSIVAAASQLLNFDGYQVVSLNGDEVVLDVALLKSQFQI